MNSNFHFSVHRASCPLLHPDAEPGVFQSELWKYDVAEFFIASPDRSEYLEFNLAPNGAWWSCFFNKPREVSRINPLRGVKTYAEIGEEGWQVDAMIPRKEFPWPNFMDCALNASFILDSPQQRFVTLAHLGRGKPDFHRPQDFLPMRLSSEEAGRQTSPDA